jgi:hypothetical protein
VAVRRRGAEGPGPQRPGGAGAASTGGVPAEGAGGAATDSLGPSGGAIPAASSVFGGTGSGAAGSGTVVGAGRAGASGLPVAGRGWDSRYVYIGVTTQKDAEQAYASAGYSGIDIGDTTAQADAIASYVNSHGGLLGRQVKIIFDDVPTIASAENPDQYANQVCAYYAQDHRSWPW